MEPISEEDRFQHNGQPDKSRFKGKAVAKQQRKFEAAAGDARGSRTAQPRPAGPKDNQRLALKRDERNEDTDVETGGVMAAFCRRLACHVGQYSEIGQGVCGGAGPIYTSDLRAWMRFSCELPLLGSLETDVGVPFARPQVCV